MMAAMKYGRVSARVNGLAVEWRSQRTPDRLSAARIRNPLREGAAAAD
jgi:hypothetical protein